MKTPASTLSKTPKITPNTSAITPDPLLLVADWRTLPPTIKQIDYLAQHGQPIPTTRGSASRMITAIVDAKREACGWADDEELALMGYPDDFGDKD